MVAARLGRAKAKPAQSMRLGVVAAALGLVLLTVVYLSAVKVSASAGDSVDATRRSLVGTQATAVAGSVALAEAELLGTDSGPICPGSWDYLYFLHIQKTAGTFLTGILKASLEGPPPAAGAPTLPPASRLWCPREALPEALYRNCHHRPRLAPYTDHITTAMHALFPGRCAGFATHEDLGLLGALLDARQRHRTLLLTMLREPVTRVISEYYYYRGRNEFPHTVAGIHNDTGHGGLLVYARLRTRANLMTHLLGGATQCRWADAAGRPSATLAPGPDEDVGEGDDGAAAGAALQGEPLLEVARARLRHFCWVGLQERMGESLALLRLATGLGGVEAAGWDPVNVNDYPSVPEDVRQRIAAANWLDMELYEYAEELFQDRLQAAGLAADA